VSVREHQRSLAPPHQGRVDGFEPGAAAPGEDQLGARGPEEDRKELPDLFDDPVEVLAAVVHRRKAHRPQHAGVDTDGSGDEERRGLRVERHLAPPASGFTKDINGSPRSARRSSSTTWAPALACPSWGDAPRWGVA